MRPRTIVQNAPADVEATVQLAYRSVLRRDVDQAGLESYGAALRGGRDLAWLIGVLAESSEFQSMEARIQAKIPASTAPLTEPAHLLSNEPPMQIDLRCSGSELQLLWDHVAQTWSRLGEEEPHWSVLTQDQFRAEFIGDEQLADFYHSGDLEVERLNAWLGRAGLAIDPNAVCAEFGCGVGRITHSLARQYARVMAFDVSAAHLRAAEARMRDVSIMNVVCPSNITGKASLSALRDIDVFYSIIALQHSPPTIILDVLAQVFSALRPGGYAFFQVPTFATDYSYSAAAHLEKLGHGINAQGSGSGDMEVHFVPQHMVLELAHRAGLRTVEIQPDLSTGNLDRWISNTFLLARG